MARRAWCRCGSASLTLTLTPSLTLASNLTPNPDPNPNPNPNPNQVWLSLNGQQFSPLGLPGEAFEYAPRYPYP